jgi:cell division septation protein DedD
MASGGRKRGAGERVLEGRHVIGLFLLMLVFSAVFFTLGYVMGRNQYDGQVRAAMTPHAPEDAIVSDKPDVPIKKRPANNSAVPATKAAPDATPSDSGWEIFRADKKTDSELKAPATVSSGARPGQPGATDARSAATPVDSQKPSASAGGYILQVTAVRRESDALELAKRLQKKKFPAFVLAPQGNKYYRVQVGPYADQKSAEAAKKGLEGAGFRAIVKHG